MSKSIDGYAQLMLRSEHRLSVRAGRPSTEEKVLDEIELLAQQSSYQWHASWVDDSHDRESNRDLHLACLWYIFHCLYVNIALLINLFEY